jgi:chorismate-pyruvate lyase
MTHSAPTAGPDLRALYALFPPADDMPEHEFVPGDEVPPPYHDLLVHEHHMTVTVEAYHGGPVDVRILARQLTGEHYARKILLTLQGSGRVVQFGIMRVNFRYCSPAVRAEIEAGGTPLGRTLIKHDVLRRIEPTAYLRVIPSPAMMEWFGLDQPRPTYGRLAYIHCNNQPAVELLEIVAPAPQSK